MKKSLNFKFINPNTEEQIVQSIASSLAYNLANSTENILFDYKDLNSYKISHCMDRKF